jgi:hypothetical protein
LGSEPDTGFTAVRGNSIVEQDADPVDVFGDRDRQQYFVRGDSRLRCHDISCRRAAFGVGAVETVIAVLAASSDGVSINAAAKASGINYRTGPRSGWWRLPEGAAKGTCGGLARILRGLL